MIQPSIDSSTNWPALVAGWAQRFEAHLENRLAWLHSLVRQNTNDMSVLRPHFGSFLVALEFSYLRPPLHRLAAELIDALEDWPFRWGEWQAWDKPLSFALQFYRLQGEARSEARLSARLASLLLQRHEIERAWQLSQAALRLAQRVGASAELLQAALGAEVILCSLGRSGDALAMLDALQKQLHSAQPQTDPSHPGRAFFQIEMHICALIRYQGRLQEAVQRAQAAVAGLEAANESDRLLLADAYRDRATLYWANAQYEQAADDLQRAIHYYKTTNDVAAIWCQGNLGLVYVYLLKFKQAQVYLRASIQLAESLKSRWRLARDLGSLVLAYLFQGNLPAALTEVERQIDLLRTTQDQATLILAENNLGVIHAYSENYALALPLLETLPSRYAAQGRDDLHITSLIDLSVCLHGLGRAAEARQLAAEALRLARGLAGSSFYEMLALRGLAHVSSPEEAAEILPAALQMARQYSRRLDEAGCLLSLSGLAKDAAGQQALWQAGANLLIEIEAEAWLERCSPQSPPLVVIAM